MRKRIATAMMAFAGAASAFAQTPAGSAAASSTGSGSAAKYLAAAIAVSVAAVAGGMAVAKIGSAAMGAMAEKPELSGKALPYVGLAEGICLWGFLVALLILLL
jgi:V/A-type H+-transporting ATPase subunit K